MKGGKSINNTRTYDRITEKFGLEGTLKTILLHPPGGMGVDEDLTKIK